MRPTNNNITVNGDYNITSHKKIKIKNKKDYNIAIAKTKHTQIVILPLIKRLNARIL